MSNPSISWVRSLTLGIVGGAGPRASALLYQKVIEKCQQTYGCSADQDFPKIWIYNYPFSPMLQIQESNENRKILIRELEEALNQLSLLKVQRISIACNTLHCFLPECNQIPKRLIQITDLVKQELIRLKPKRALVLGTETTVRSDLFRNLQSKIVYPTIPEQNNVSSIIDRILGGFIQETDAIKLKTIISNYSDSIDSTILGCTELSVIANKFPMILAPEIPVIDPIDLLSLELIKN